MIELVSRRSECIACGSPELTSYVRTTQIHLYRCKACGGLTALPRPTQSDLTTFHDSEVYYNHPYFEHRRWDLDGAAARCRQVVRFVQRALPAFRFTGARHLDVGCDSGLLLEAFQRGYGTVPVGIDVSANSVELTQARGIECHHTDLTRAKGLTDFSLITAIDVIEHVADPVEFLRQVRESEYLIPPPRPLTGAAAGPMLAPC